MPGRDDARPSTVLPERELRKLDRWSFHVLPGDGVGCDHVVLGTTGSFALVFEGDSVPQGFLIPGIHRARRAARRLRGHVTALGVEGETVAVLCPRTSSVFAPRTVRGVRVVPPVLLAKEISERNRSAMPHQVQRAAESLTRSLGQSR
jgi:hypothetical protein